jgi:phage FluMu gp28-like protein
MGRRFGADRIEAVMTSQNTYLEGFPRLKERVEARTIALPADRDVLDDFRMVQRVRGVPMVPDRSQSKADGAKGQRHGDTAIAAMMLCMAADEDLAPIELHRGTERTSSGLDGYTMTQTGFGTVRRAGSALGGFGGF